MTATSSEPRTTKSEEIGVLALLGVTVVVIALGRATSAFDGATVRTWSTIFVAMCLQALPFLVLGVAVSGLIAAYVPPGLVPRLLPRRPAAAVPVAGLCGIALPGCECGSVPIAGRLIATGTAPAPALTFLLAAPAINPVVLVATAVAFPGRPEVVAARFVAALLAAIVVGWWWTRPSLSALAAAVRGGHGEHDSAEGRRFVFTGTALHDLSIAGGYLVVGAAIAATIQTVVPRSIVDGVAGNEVTAVLTMVTLAILLSICSEADAFVAAGLGQFSLTSRLVFLVVGPMVDLKLIAMQQGVFGGAFVRRFATATVIVGTASALLVGSLLL